MLLMVEEQDGRFIWVVVELHRPKGRVRSRIVQHLGSFRDRDAAETGFRERLQTDARLRAIAEKWALAAASVLTDRKARSRFLLCGVSTGGIAPDADAILERREQDAREARERIRASAWSATAPIAAFQAFDLPASASLSELKTAYRKQAFLLHPDLGGDHASMVALNAAYDEAAAYVDWRG